MAIDNATLANSYSDGILAIVGIETSASKSGTPIESIGALKYFNSIPIVDNLGRTLHFESMTTAMKEAFLNAWKKERSESLVQAMAQSSSAYKDIRASAKAMKLALDDYSRTRSIEFAKIYANHLARCIAELKDFDSTTASSKSGVASLRLKGVDALRGYYSTGVITYTGASSSSTTSFWTYGHVSLCEQVAWNRKWEDNPSQSYINIGSWGNSDYGYAGYSQSGVGRETAEYWLNRVSQLPMPIFTLYKVRNYEWYFDWASFSFRVRYTTVSEAESARAIQYAQQQIGKPFNWFPFNKNVTDSFYCSSLVWNAWKSVNPNYDLDSGVLDWWVAPSDVIGAENCFPLVEGAN